MFSKSASDDSHNANNNNNGSTESFSGGGGSTSTDASKSVDEIMPLLHQTSIHGNHGGIADDGEAGDESDGNDGSSVTMNVTKHGRKGGHHHHRSQPPAENGTGDHRGMMSFSRKKLKTKYMKSKTAKASAAAGVVLDGVSGQMFTMTNGGGTSGGNAGSDGEK